MYLQVKPLILYYIKNKNKSFSIEETFISAIFVYVHEQDTI